MLAPWLCITRKVNYLDVSKTPSNFYYLEITSKLLQNYFGSASEMLSGTRIVITIRTKFPDSKELNFISIYLSRVNSEAGTKVRMRLVGSIDRLARVTQSYSSGSCSQEAEYCCHSFSLSILVKPNLD